MAEREIKVKWTGDAKDFERASQAAEKAVRGVEDGVERSEAKFRKATPAVAGFLAGFAGSAVVGFGKDLFNLGQQLDMMEKKAATVFEDSLPTIQKWSEETAHGLGLTRNQLTGLAANFADLLKPMGFTAAEAAQLSQRALNLSGALSAWSNGTRSAAEVTDILIAAMLGEREQLKGLGVAISAADVQTRILEKGQEELTGTALQQAEALATLELITEKSTDAQKAWNSSSTDNVRTTNELNAKFAEVREQLAEKLYPIFIKIGAWLVETGIPKIEEIANKVKTWWEEADELRDMLGAIAETGGKLGGWFADLIGWLDSGYDKIIRFGEALDELQRKLGIKGEFSEKVERAGDIVRDRIAQGMDPNNPDAYVGPVARRANGGPVSMNMPYMVGERGPELFVPSGNGMIIPNDELGGANVTVNVSLLDGSQVTPQLARKLGDAIRRELAAVA